MVKQLNGLVHWNRYFPEAVCAIALLLVSFQPAFGATKPDGTLEVTDGKEQFMSTLASMPYTSSGTGPVLYVLECSVCLASQAFEKDWKGQLDGVEIRRILIAFNAATANETAYLARTRDINDFYAFMNHTKVAPPIKACNCPEDNKAIQAFKSVAGPFEQVLKPIMIKNGWPKDSRAFPQFMWETNARVYVGAYSKNSFPEILSVLRSGSQTTQASAPPSRASADDSASTLTEASAVETKGQVVIVETSSPNPVAAAPTNNSGSQSVGSGGLGPDVLGLRIGMTPDQARAIFKSQSFGSSTKSPNRPPDSYVEGSKTLAFSLPGQAPQPVVNTNYVAWIYGSITEIKSPAAESSSHGLSAIFGPVTGQEGIISLSRQVGIPASNKPTVDAFDKTLLEKYGTPTEKPSPEIYLWVYESNGTLRKPISSAGTGTGRRPIRRPNYITCPAELVEGLKLIPYFQRQDFKPLVAKNPSHPEGCGAILLRVVLALEGSRYAGPETLVNGYSTRMTGFDATIRAFDAANEIIDKAQADASGAAIKKGQQQKPEL